MSDYPKVLAEDQFGNKLVRVGEIDLGGYLDRLIKVMRPDGTFLSDKPVALQRFLKFDESDWREPE
ncbi:MAG: hypothetical protein ACLQPD_00385 [Desulfomonilaceae bacterium]